jgi:hypothetical protein
MSNLRHAPPAFLVIFFPNGGIYPFKQALWDQFPIPEKYIKAVQLQGDQGITTGDTPKITPNLAKKMEF